MWSLITVVCICALLKVLFNLWSSFRNASVSVNEPNGTIVSVCRSFSFSSLKTRMLTAPTDSLGCCGLLVFLDTFILFYFILFYFILFYFILFYFFLLFYFIFFIYFILFYFILFIILFILFYFILFIFLILFKIHKMYLILEKKIIFNIKFIHFI